MVNLPPRIPDGIVIRQISQPTSSAAVVSLVFGILSILTGCCSFGLFSIIACLAGHLALAETKSGEIQGRGMAVAGLTLGYIFVLPVLIFSIFFFATVVIGAA